jgi:hypothetical protein
MYGVEFRARLNDNKVRLIWFWVGILKSFNQLFGVNDVKVEGENLHPLD